MDRRSFLLSAGTGLAVGLVPAALATAPAHASLDRELPGSDADRKVLRFIDRARRRREAVHSRTLRRLGRDGTDPIEQAFARSTAAMAAIERLPRLAVPDQVHPAFQAFAAELLDEVGAGVHALRSLFDAVLDAGSEPDPGSLAPVFEWTGRYLDDEDELSEASRRINRGSLDELQARIEDEGLQGVTRHQARRMRRLADLSERIASAGGQSGVLAPADARVIDEVAEGKRRWSSLVVEDDEPMSAGRVLGVIACGLGVLVGGLVVFLSIGCAVSCDAPGLIAVALLGGVLIGACIYGIVRLVGGAQVPRRGRSMTSGPPTPAPARRAHRSTGPPGPGRYPPDRSPWMRSRRRSLCSRATPHRPALAT